MEADKTKAIQHFISRPELLSIILILALALLCMLPHLLTGWAGGWDSVYYKRYSLAFGHQFLDGDLYPRWLFDMNGGLGNPTFFFYSPLAFYLTSLALGGSRLINEDYLEHITGDFGWYHLALVMVGVNAAGALVYYAAGRRLLGIGPALFATGAWIFFPYKVYFSAYSRYAIPEFIALCAAAGLLFFVRDIGKGKWPNIVGVAVMSGAIVLAHAPSAIMLIPALYAYSWLSAENGLKAQTAVFLVVGGAFGLALSAVYWLPMVAHLDQITFEKNADIWHYSESFLFAGRSTMEYRISTWATVPAIVMGGAAFAIGLAHPDRALRRVCASGGFVVATAVFLTTAASAPIWELIAPLQEIQHPWRFNVVLGTFIPLAMGIAVDTVARRRSRVGALLIALVFAGVLAASFEPVKRIYWVWSDAFAYLSGQNIGTASDHDNSADANPFPLVFEGIGKDTYYETPVWRPKTAPDTIFSEQSLRQSIALGPQTRLLEGDARVDVVEWAGASIVLSYVAAKESCFEISQLYFPNWRASEIKNTTGAEFVLKQAESGLLAVCVPIGDGVVKLRVAGGPSAALGTAVTAIAAFAILILSGLKHPRGAAPREALINAPDP